MAGMFDDMYEDRKDEVEEAQVLAQEAQALAEEEAAEMIEMYEDECIKRQMCMQVLLIIALSLA